jgi:hypothetical protein
LLPSYRPYQTEDLPRWLADPHKKAGRVSGNEGGQIEMEM